MKAVRTCRACGCTDADACTLVLVSSAAEIHCWWTKRDLCSGCDKPMMTAHGAVRQKGPRVDRRKKHDQEKQLEIVQRAAHRLADATSALEELVAGVEPAQLAGARFDQACAELLAAGRELVQLVLGEEAA